MKHRTIPFRDLLQRVLPVDRLPSEDQARISHALEEGDSRALETLGLEMLDRLADLGHLRLVDEVLQGDEKIRRYRDLTSGNTVALLTPVSDEDEGIYKIPLPLRDWKGATTLDQIRTLFNLYDKILTQDSQLLRGPADVMRQVMLTARQTLQCERVSFWGANLESEVAEPLKEISAGPYDEDLVREWVLERRYLVMLPDLPAQINPETQELETEFQSLAMIPIGLPDQAVYGVLHAWSAHSYHFNEDRQGLLSLIAECATDLLRRTQILENLVFVDAGTQVYNRAYFNLQLENEIARARREEHSLALSIVDIDDFRSINSRYGYEAGNDVLATAAQVLKSGLRPFDSVARWGGEEFALILTSPVTQEDASAVCERLRQSAELSQITVTGLSGESVTTRLTVSIGGAIYPLDGSTGATLWRAANAALVHAKQTGKNKVVFASSLPRGQED
jgi:diguanylate cyclase (GGDEF)-like protein